MHVLHPNVFMSWMQKINSSVHFSVQIRNCSKGVYVVPVTEDIDKDENEDRLIVLIFPGWFS